VQQTVCAPDKESLGVQQTVSQDIVNCVCSKFRGELDKEGGHDVEKRLEKEFPAWFRSHVSGSRFIFDLLGLRFILLQDAY